MSDRPPAALRLRLLWGAYALSGAAMLAYEVVWTRYLQLVVGSSIYAVAAMLSALMAGLAVGAWIGARVGDRLVDPARVIALCEIGTAVAALLSFVILRLVPVLHLWAFRRFQLHPAVYFALDVAVALPVVLVPTVLMGLVFPLVARLAATEHPGRIAAAVGGAYAANTVGAIAGSALAGFLLVPLVGLWGALLAAAAANVLAAGLVLASARRSARPSAAAALLLLAVPLAWAMRPPEVPLGYHLAGRALQDPAFADRIAAMKVVFDAWPPQGRVQVLEDDARTRVLVVDGRIEGATRGTERATQHLLALVPGALRGDPAEVFGIGLGTGRTLVVMLDTYRRARVQVAEANPAVLEAVRRFFRSDLGGHVVAAEGRAELRRKRGALDAIVSGPSFPVDAMSGSLFTREFFELARERLAPDGVLVAWAPGYLLDADQLRALVATAASAFPHLAVWRVRSNDDLVLIASGEPFDDRQLPARLARLDEPLWASAEVIEPVLHPGDVAGYLGEAGPPRLSTDDDPWLELAMARNLVRGREWLR